MIRIHFFLVGLIVISQMTKAQFFLQGPDAPLVNLSYVNGAFVLDLNNPPNSNNFGEMYQESDPRVPNPNDPDQHWHFRGYQVFQLLNDTVGAAHLNDANVSRQSAQSDVQDSLAQLYNWTYDSLIGNCVPVQMVSGANTGSQLTYTLSNDVFTGLPFHADSMYCFMVVTYASNPYHEDSSCPGLPSEYFRSRKTPNGILQSVCATPMSVGFNEQIDLNEPLIHPNPNSGTFRIQLDEVSSVVILDSSGRIVFDQNPISTRVVELSDFSPGMYNVRCRNNDGLSSTGRFIVQ